ncbi:MAG: HEAT repeat domain-containing protein [Candidatus Hydrogenedentes bacterium]|nr:HEAT repeat domain-containing protein [Candidatus Hydrogenedentota bacterium]
MANEGPAAVEPLIACLGEEDGQIRDAAAQTLGRLGSAAVQPLIGCLKDPNASVRRSAVLALGRLGDARAVDPLTACLKDGDEGVRGQTEEALRDIELKPFIEKGMRLRAVADADLDGDGTMDYVVVLERQEDPNDPDWADAPRPLLILLRDATGPLKLAKRNDKIVLPRSGGGMWGDPLDGLEAGTKTFTVSHYGGTSWRWGNSYTFNYSRIDKTWQLVSVDILESVHVIDPDAEAETHEYTPPKDYGKIDIADFDPDNYLGKGDR